MKKIILFALMFCVIASSAQSAIAANQKNECSKIKHFFGKCPHQIEQKRMLEELNLSKSQMKQVKEIYLNKKSETKPVYKQIDKTIKTRNKLVKTNASKDVIAVQDEKIAELSNQIKVSEKNFKKQFESILTPEQRIKLFEMKIKKLMDGTLDIFLNDEKSGGCKNEPHQIEIKAIFPPKTKLECNCK